MKEEGLLANEEDLRYLNRVADLLFLLRRYEDRALPPEAVDRAGTLSLHAALITLSRQARMALVAALLATLGGPGLRREDGRG